RYLVLVLTVYLATTLPYLATAGFYDMVLANKKQMLLLSVFYEVGSLKIYLLAFFAIVIYGRFAGYKKINDDLLYMYLALLFSVFIVLIRPAPGWYIWVFPYISILFIKQSAKDSALWLIYAFFSGCYLIFFIGGYLPDHQDLYFRGREIWLKTGNDTLRNLSFTLLEATVCGIIYICYRYGVRSNLVYKKPYNLAIGIGGDSGVGKTTLLNDLKQLLGHGVLELGEGVVGIEGDGDHKWEREHNNWLELTHLNPKANHLHRQTDDLLLLKTGKKVYRSDYDHATGKFTPPRCINPAEYIIICGLHPFYLPKMRKLIDVKIYLDTDEKLRRHWKILRDMEERGHTREKIMGQIEARIDDAQKYIHPQKKFADVTLSYFPRTDFNVGDSAATPEILLGVSLDAGISVDRLIDLAEQRGLAISWDYARDLQKQYLLFEHPLPAATIEDIGRQLIYNIEEIIKGRIIWADGYRGLVQLVLLLVVSEKMKMKEGHE
ncbi:MAG: hypothetical protein HQK57_07275, partial [Deltaproteobacteria bacterium]|nr:hypothetical protein [Deltaproteobacteria bacterium]